MGKLISGVTQSLGLTADPEAGKGLAGASQAQIERAISELNKLNIPDIEKQKIELQLLSEAGFLNAEQLQREGEIAIDPRLRQAQMDALSQLRERGQAGLTEEDKAIQDIMLRDIAAQEQAGQKAILQGMAERGALDSGAQLASQLASQQSAYTRAANQASQNAIAAAQARREALSQAGSMAQGMEATQFGQGQSERSYRQAIDQFNAQNRQDIAAKNLGIKQQDIGLKNQQQMYNKELLQKQFENQRGLTQMKTNAMMGQASNLMQQSQAEAQAAQAQAAGMRDLVVGGASAVAKSDKNLKENISTPDSESIQVFLDKLKPYKYNYKDDPSEEDQMGVMAQDLEKSPLGQDFVEEVNGDKVVDYGKMASTQMAAISDLHRRLKRLEGK
jgi:hypothetical protein